MQVEHGVAGDRARAVGDERAGGAVAEKPVAFADRKSMVTHIQKLREEMAEAAKNLDFETAAQIRDEVFRLEKADLELR